MSRRTCAASLGGGVQFATGTYTGDGAATQAIIGVGFQPRFLLVYAQLALTTIDYGLKTDQEALRTKFFDQNTGWRYDLDIIVSLDANGFTVGDGTGSPSGNVFNVLDRVYTFVAFR